MCTLPRSFKSGMGSFLKSGRGTSGIASTASPSHAPNRGWECCQNTREAKALTALSKSGADLQTGNAPDRRGEKETKEEEMPFDLILFTRIWLFKMCNNLSICGNMFFCLTTKSFPPGLALFLCFTEHWNRMEILVKCRFRFSRSGWGPIAPCLKVLRDALCCQSVKDTLSSWALGY